MENKFFENLSKVSTGTSASLDEAELLQESNSMTFVSLKSVQTQDVAKLINDLQRLIGKLDNATVKLYLNDVGTKYQIEYENVLNRVKQNQGRLNYLSGFFESIKCKVAAAKKKMEESDKKLKNAEERKLQIDETLKRLNANLKKQRQLKNVQRNQVLDGGETSNNTRTRYPLIMSQARKVHAANRKNPNHDIELRLAPIENSSRIATRSEEFETASQDSDSTIQDEEDDYADEDDWLDEEDDFSDVE